MGSYEVLYAPAALDDLRAIFSYIAFDLKAGQAAEEQTNRIRRKVRSLDSMPGRYRKVEWEPRASMGMYQLPVDDYVIYYLVDQELRTVTIVRIFYGGRDVESIIKSEEGQADFLA